MAKVRDGPANTAYDQPTLPSKGGEPLGNPNHAMMMEREKLSSSKIEYESREHRQRDSDSIIDSTSESSMENTRDSSDTKMWVSDDIEESKMEGTRSRRRKNKRKNKKKCAVISMEELGWLWYDERYSTITEAEETWNLGKNLGIKSIETDSAMARKIEKMMCLEIGGSTKGKEKEENEGDFNAIIEESERVGRACYWDIGEMERFNNFIEGSDLVEIQLVGRRFTWYRPDGTCKSKLDRFLVNSNWLNKWSGAKLRGGKRSLSDHGPRQFKFFNHWIQHPRHKGLIEKVWSSSMKQGWAGFMIKEKLKEVKVELKAWSKVTFNGMDRRIEVKKEELEMLDILDDTFGLEEEEISGRQDLLGDLMMESSWKESQLLQKSKIKWLKEGDANSTFFHNWVKSRHKRNEIMGLWNNNTWVESVQGVKQLAHDHFKKQFEAVGKNSAYFSEALFRSYVGTTDNEGQFETSEMSAETLRTHIRFESKLSEKLCLWTKCNRI
ncbi:hypothetical protein ACS0TY_011283 [Phlomoides rotata]